jgi:hypothetical protein
MFGKPMATLSPLACVAMEYLKQALEVELGSKIHYLELRIDPPSVTEFVDNQDRCSIRIRGKCCQEPHNHDDHGFQSLDATVSIVQPNSATPWAPKEASIQLSDVLYRATWKLYGSRIAAKIWRVHASKELCNTGYGYYGSERWEERLRSFI